MKFELKNPRKSDSGYATYRDVYINDHNVGYTWGESDYWIYLDEDCRNYWQQFMLSDFDMRIWNLNIDFSEDLSSRYKFSFLNCSLRIQLKPYHDEVVPKVYTEMQIKIENWNLPFSFLDFSRNFRIVCENNGVALYESDEEYLNNGFGLELNNIDENSFLCDIYNKAIPLLRKVLDNTIALSMKEIDHEDNNYRINIKVQEELKNVVKQYLSYFNQFVKKTTQKTIDFNVGEDDNSLILNFKVDNHEELERIKDKLSEYVSFLDKKEDEIIPLITPETTEKDQMMLMLDLKSQIRQFHLMIQDKQEQLKIVSHSLGIDYTPLEHVSASTLIEGVKQITESTMISNISLELNQNQHQIQNQSQELQNNLSNLTSSLDDIINYIQEPNLKEEGIQLLEDIYPIITQPTEEKISEKGLLPKLENYMKKVKKGVELIDEGKDIYNKFAENYNTIANIFKYSTLAILS